MTLGNIIIAALILAVVIAVIKAIKSHWGGICHTLGVVCFIALCVWGVSKAWSNNTTEIVVDTYAEWSDKANDLISDGTKKVTKEAKKVTKKTTKAADKAKKTLTK